MTKKLKDYKWGPVFGPDYSVTIEPHETLGWDIAEAQRLVIVHHSNLVMRLLRMTDEEFLKHYGYEEHDDTD